MFYQEIQLINFRNYSHTRFEFVDTYNIIVGKNGVGKTNLLEALYFSAFLRGFKQSKALLKEGEKSFLLKLKTDKYLLKVSYEQGKGKRIFKDNVLLSSVQEHIGTQPTVAILPDDIELIKGSSADIRTWVNKLLSQKSAEYLKHLIAYNKHLKARNLLLKAKQVHSKLLEIYEEKMLQSAIILSEFHRKFVAEIRPVFKKYYSCLNSEEEIDIMYLPSVGQYTANTWRESLEKDFLLQYTSVGIHRDKFPIFIHGKSAKHYASQGQTKSLAIALKLAEYELVRSRETPVLLIDDIAEKLDEERLEKLFRLLQELITGQVFITDTSEARIRKFLGEKFHLLLIQ